MTTTVATYRRITQPVNAIGDYMGLLGLRLLLAWEFWESGVEKLNGANWFADIHDKFPFPFDLLPVALTWPLATWAELLGAVALVLGLGTRIAAVSLLVVTAVAWISVHAGLGYNVCQNGFKLPLMYLVMLLPLVTHGAGKLSVDHWIART